MHGLKEKLTIGHLVSTLAADGGILMDNKLGTGRIARTCAFASPHKLGIVKTFILMKKLEPVILRPS
jgi:hypothetical protein